MLLSKADLTEKLAVPKSKRPAASKTTPAPAGDGDGEVQSSSKDASSLVVLLESSDDQKGVVKVMDKPQKDRNRIVILMYKDDKKPKWAQKMQIVVKPPPGTSHKDAVFISHFIALELIQGSLTLEQIKARRDELLAKRVHPEQLLGHFRFLHEAPELPYGVRPTQDFLEKYKEFPEGPFEEDADGLAADSSSLSSKPEAARVDLFLGEPMENFLESGRGLVMLPVQDMPWTTWWALI